MYLVYIYHSILLNYGLIYLVYVVFFIFFTMENKWSLKCLNVDKKLKIIKEVEKCQNEKKDIATGIPVNNLL